MKWPGPNTNPNVLSWNILTKRVEDRQLLAAADLRYYHFYDMININNYK